MGTPSSVVFRVGLKYEVAGNAFVFQVSLLGFQLILNQTECWTESRAGHGRVFFGLDYDQIDGLLQHIQRLNISTEAIQWRAPTLVIRDLDGNEFSFWYPESERASLEAELPGN